MGTPRRRLTRVESQQRTRVLLLEAAEHVFRTRGYQAASLEEIASLAGFSKGAVYSNFASKEDLFLTLLEQRVAMQEQAWEAALPRYATLTALIEALAGSFQYDLEDGQAWVRLTVEFWVHAQQDAGLRERYGAVMHKVENYTRALLERQLAQLDNPPPLPAAQLAPLILALGTGLALHAPGQQACTARDLYVTALRRLFGAEP